MQGRRKTVHAWQTEDVRSLYTPPPPPFRGLCKTDPPIATAMRTVPTITHASRRNATHLLKNRSRREQARRVRERLERQGLQVLPEIVNVQVSTRREELRGKKPQ